MAFLLLLSFLPDHFTMITYLLSFLLKQEKQNKTKNYTISVLYVH